MTNLLMITGDRSLAQGKVGAFYSTLEEFSKHWDRIDIICPIVEKVKTKELFDNVFIHTYPWHLIFQPLFIVKIGKELIQRYKHSLITVHDYPPFYNGLGAFILSLFTWIPYILDIHHNY